MSRPSIGRLMALERLIKNDAIMLPRFRQAGGVGIILAKAMNRPHDFVRTDTAYVLDLDFLPGLNAHAKLMEVGGATIVKAGSLASAGVTSIVSKNADGVTLDTYAIPAAVQALTGYGWSTASVCNYVDFERKVYVQNVDSVDLGTLSWTYRANWNGGPVLSSSGISGTVKKAATASDIADFMTALQYQHVSRNFLYANPDSTGMSIGADGYLIVRDSAYSDAASFKTDMSGVMLYFELATPVETDISAYIADDVTLAVESGGTLTFTNSNQIPVPSKIEYIRRT